MLGKGRTRAQVLSACLVAAAVSVTAVVPHASGQIADKKAEAAALKARIDAQGHRLSVADEQFNQARLQRQRIESQAASARGQVASAEKEWGALREQLAKRVRMLYMHPSAPIDAWLGATSVSDLARKHKFGSSVLTADADLVTKTERARQDLLARAKRLDGIKVAARSKEQEVAAAREDVADAMTEQRALLNNVNGEIAQLIEEQREAELAAAEAPAPPPSDPSDPTPERTARPAPSPLGGDDGPAPTATPAPTTEPVGPAPPVKGGAGTAVAKAAAQIGKPYEWAADGPDSFDCSGLTMYAWAAAGVSLPHSSQAQFASLPHVSKDQLRPGDLVFYGSPIHHVGIYEGGGMYINAPTTGEFVRRNSIERPDWAGAARP